MYMRSDVFNPGYLKQLELLRMRSRKSYLGSRQGGHVSLKRGHGIEFSDYRKYELGDNPRHIDWGVYARSERLYVKRFQEEQALSVVIICDGTASMATPDGEGKWEMARDIALSLTYVALMQHDSVRVAVPGHMVSPPFSTGSGFHRLAEMMDEVEPGGEMDFVEEVSRVVSQVRFPGIAIFISDLLMPPEHIQKAMNLMRAKNLDISVVQVVAPSDRDPLVGAQSVIAVDSETGEEVELQLDEATRKEYQYRFDQHSLTIKDFLHRHRIQYSQAFSEQGVQHFVIRELAGSSLLA
jgi:uncharacterized protein (DUF58 family)